MFVFLIMVQTPIKRKKVSHHVIKLHVEQKLNTCKKA